MKPAAKQEWRDYICRSGSGGRLLSSIGASVSLSSTETHDKSELSRFLAALRRGRTDIRIVASAVDLLDAAYIQYFSKDVHGLLDHLSSETVKDEQTVGPALRGNPRWDRTLLARKTGTLPPGRYFSRLPRRSFARPENALLKWLVNDILQELHHLERQVGVEGLPVELRTLYASVDGVSRAYGVSDIEVPARLLPDMVFAARRGRRREYRQAADIAVRRDELNREVARGKWKALLSLLSSGWLEPVDVDDLFELYALTCCLEAIAGDLGFGPPVELGLVIRHRQYVARFVSDTGASVEVFFDQSPVTSLGAKGRYVDVIQAHKGVTGNARRPDITIASTSPGGERRVTFIEVKKTQSREYLSDSIYKAFGYLYDYGVLWPVGDDLPKVVLFVPDDVHLHGGMRPDVVFVSGSDKPGVARVLKAALLGA